MWQIGNLETCGENRARGSLMNRSASGNGWIVVACCAVVLAAAAAIFFATRTRHHSVESTLENEAPSPSGFRELARESGIQFRMRFLPGEQGENFKINLYDHG